MLLKFLVYKIQGHQSDPPERSIGDYGYFWWILNKGKGGGLKPYSLNGIQPRKGKLDTLFQKPFDNPLSVELAM